ncbi:hypothetical protein M0R45_009039 [Rubus argutus]|uniref:Uncharacterized protein n=1 Tax=Rubus argutus TaxID=59490 RepID=A0AAW1Y3F6_RUBAR
MSDSESQSVSSGNAFSGESERSLSAEAVESDTSSTSSSRSCSPATEAARDHILMGTVNSYLSGVYTGEDIEPLAAVPYKKSGPSKASAKSRGASS